MEMVNDFEYKDYITKMKQNEKEVIREVLHCQIEMEQKKKIKNFFEKRNKGKYSMRNINKHDKRMLSQVFFIIFFFYFIYVRHC
jgi:hypothetical protein